MSGIKPYHSDKWVTIHHGDCREILPSLDKGSAIVTDPPYELGFMGKSWDSKGISFQKETWQIIRDSCFPGAMLLSFGGTRTFHRIACAIEDAGWEIRDTIAWVYGSGFPKSLDISKAIDKQAGIKREVIGYTQNARPNRVGKETKLSGLMTIGGEITEAQTPEAQLWDGYGTALKPAYEPIIVAMNPLDGTFAQNALKHGVAGLNIDECRIETRDSLNGGAYTDAGMRQPMSGDERQGAALGMFQSGKTAEKSYQQPNGRFPANFIHDGSQAVTELFPNTKSGLMKQHINGGQFNVWGKQYPRDVETIGDNGSAARFFYCAKASKSERNKGCEELEPEQSHPSRKEGNPGGDTPRNRGVHKIQNNHPTVKPLALMEYLVKLVKMPEYNLIKDPFMGSGTTLLACIRLGIPCIGIDNDERSCEIAAKRCSQEVMELEL